MISALKETQGMGAEMRIDQPYTAPNDLQMKEWTNEPTERSSFPCVPLCASLTTLSTESFHVQSPDSQNSSRISKRSKIFHFCKWENKGPEEGLPKITPWVSIRGKTKTLSSRLWGQTASTTLHAVYSPPFSCLLLPHLWFGFVCSNEWLNQEEADRNGMFQRKELRR